MVHLLAIALTLGIAGLIRTVFIIIKTPCPQCPEATGDKSVSILLPVRNETDRVLHENVCSLLAQNYNRLEIVAVDDRSTDHSLTVLRRFASHAPRSLKVVSGRPPPEGWLGKIFALEQAKENANGDWLLFVDADVLYMPNAVSCAMAFCEENNLDALSLLPKIDMYTFWESVCMPVIAWLSLMRVSPTQANRTSSRACFGQGNFILVRRKAHQSIGGFEVYRSAILDDCEVMERLKQSGFRVAVADGTHLIRTRMYSSLREIVNGFSKNAFAALSFSYFRVVSVISIQFLLVVLPIFCLVEFPIGITNPGTTETFLGFAALASMALTMLVFGLKMGADWRFFVLYPLGHIMAAVIIGYSMIAHSTKLGVDWKGRRIIRLKTREGDEYVS